MAKVSGETVPGALEKVIRQKGGLLSISEKGRQRKFSIQSIVSSREKERESL